MNTTNQFLRYLLSATLLITPGTSFGFNTGDEKGDSSEAQIVMAISEHADALQAGNPDLSREDAMAQATEEITDQEPDGKKGDSSPLDTFLGNDGFSDDLKTYVVDAVTAAEPETAEAESESIFAAIISYRAKQDDEARRQAEQIEAENARDAGKELVTDAANAAASGAAAGQLVVDKVVGGVQSGFFERSWEHAQEYWSLVRQGEFSQAHEYLKQEVLENSIAALAYERAALSGSISGAKVGEFALEEGTIRFGAYITAGTAAAIVGNKIYQRTLGWLINPVISSVNQTVRSFSPIARPLHNRVQKFRKPILDQIKPLRAEVTALKGQQSALQDSIRAANKNVSAAKAKARQLQQTWDKLDDAAKSAKPLSEANQALRTNLSAADEATRAASKAVESLSSQQTSVAVKLDAAYRNIQSLSRRAFWKPFWRTPIAQVARLGNWAVTKTGKWAVLIGAASGVTVWAVHTATSGTIFIVEYDANSVEEARAAHIKWANNRIQEIDALLTARTMQYVGAEDTNANMDEYLAEEALRINQIFKQKKQ